MLNRDDILNAKDIETEEVKVPEWGGSVLVRTMTGAGRDAFEQGIVASRVENKQKNIETIRARMVALSVVDESGNLLFTDEDIPALGKKSAKALDRVYSVCSRLNALLDGDVEELAKNSETGPSADSTFD